MTRETTKWTDEQWDAISAKDCNLLVAAAAGAGKTAVLVERIIRKITDREQPVDIDRLLIVTFTNAAAAEMRERIAEAITAVIEDKPDAVNMHRQLTLLSKARITTIHSFCLDVIRSNFSSLTIDPGFRITDETEATLLQLEALQELFEAQYEAETENQAFLALLDCYGGNRDDQALQDMVLNIYKFMQSSPWPEQWLDAMTAGFDVPQGQDFGTTVWGKVLLEAVGLELIGLHALLAQAVDRLRSAGGLEKYLAVFAQDLANLTALVTLVTGSGSTDWDSIFRALQSISFNRLPPLGKDVDKAMQEYAKKTRDNVKAQIKKIQAKAFTADSAAILADMHSIYPLLGCLTELVKSFSARYAAKKQKKSVVDFNDLEHFCLAILSEAAEAGELKPSEVALGYRERFAEILVDEYQDSNLVQEIMLKLISRTDSVKPNLFMVGDVKQSIYRFRQAKPELFLEKYNRYATAQGELNRKIMLFNNFRSRHEVVDAVNFIFKQIMSVQVGELDYLDDEALHPGAVFPDDALAPGIVGGETELHLLQTDGNSAGSEARNDIESEPDADSASTSAAAEPEGGAQGFSGEMSETPEDEEMLDNIQAEARMVAKRIGQLRESDAQGHKFCVFDKNRQVYRAVEYRDIVILLRTTRNWANIFMEEMVLQGIPAFADTGTGFFRTAEVQVILSLLQIIDNPLQDIPLLSVLRSSIVGFTTDELAELRLAERQVSLYAALKVLAANGSSEAARKAGHFLANLHRWRDSSLYTSTDQLIWQLYQETSYYAIVGAMPAGEQRQANLRILFERARQFEATSYKGLFNFINFVEKLKSSKGDMGSAKLLGENDNVVRIMSIHKSKGLEFPVVILAGCGKKFNLQDMNKAILLHQDLGFGPDVVDPTLRLAYPSVAKQAIREKIKAETLSEEMRILYVALTRAREKLIITGTVQDSAKALSKWSACANTQALKLPAYEMLKAGRYLDWLGPALLRHKAALPWQESGEFGAAAGRLQFEDPSVWSIRLWQRSEVQNTTTAGEQDGGEFSCWLDTLEKETKYPVEPEVCQAETDDCSAAIARRLSWEYPYLKTASVPAKVSVSELKRRFDAELREATDSLDANFTLVKKPMFLAAKQGMSPAEAGTALHFVMQHLDYKRYDIECQLEAMVAKELLTPQQAQSVNAAKIRRFLASDLGQRVLQAEHVYREAPFNMAIPCAELYPDLHADAFGAETVLLQGVIDCYFEEPDGIVLLDYKTDFVPDGNTALLKERYKVQINNYARALALLTGKQVKEKYIYLFWTGEAVAYS